MFRFPSARGFRAHTAAALALTAGGAFVASFAAAGSAVAADPPHCRIVFEASTQSLSAGDPLKLTWTSSGADKITASWTKSRIPFSGTVTTTQQKPSRVSYQVTGSKDGQYCGGAGVQVVFLASKSSTAATHPPTPTTPVSSAASAGPSSTSTSSTPTRSATSTSSSASHSSSAAPSVAPTPTPTYPAQSPTSGSGLPWYQRPAELVLLGAIALLASVLLWNRDRIRARFTRDH